MKKGNVFGAMEYVDAELIDEAETYKGERKKKIWVRWCAAAACLCLIAAVFPLISDVLHRKGESTDQHDGVEAIAAYKHNGAFYEFTDNRKVLEKYGLPGKITEESAGEHLGWLEKNGAGYQDCVRETEIELYSYAPHPCDGVLVIRDGDRYGAALFCNHILPDDNSCVEFSEIYRTYGVEKAEDILSICEFNGIFGFEKKTNITTDREALNAFYYASLSLDCYGNDDYQTMETEVFPTEEQRVAHYKELADDSTKLRIETASGLVFFVRAAPSYGWLEGDLSYFRFNEEMTEWFSEYVG